MRYCPGLPLVITRLHLAITGGEGIGIIGRNGALKSSIISALFRLAKLPKGSITIGGVDISQIGLHGLRARVTPDVLPGYNAVHLEPFIEPTEAELWHALRQGHLVDGEKKCDQMINYRSQERMGPACQRSTRMALWMKGSNYPLSQRQLLAFARAIHCTGQSDYCD